MIPTVDITDRAAVEAIEARMVSAISSSCNCLTKTPDIAFHREDCRYRALAEGLGAIQAFRTDTRAMDALARTNALLSEENIANQRYLPKLHKRLDAALEALKFYRDQWTVPPIGPREEPQPTTLLLGDGGGRAAALLAPDT